MKKFLKFSVVILIVFAILVAIYAFTINFYVTSKSEKKIISPNDIELNSYDCILILGCGVKADKTPSVMLEDRLITGLKIYNLGASQKIIVSGDHGSDDYDEVNVMKEYLIKNGVPSENIFMDHAGFSTYESLYRTKEIFGVSKVVVVSQEYHLYRALYIAKSLGIEANGVSASSKEYNGQFMRDVREIIARNKDFLWCVFDVSPLYLGEKIDLSDSGDKTNDK